MNNTSKTGQVRSAKTSLVLLTNVPRSLRDEFEVKLPDSGFTSINEGVRTLLRDFLSGRIQYTNGMLQNQQ